MYYQKVVEGRKTLMKSNYVKIETDVSKFADRVDEITATTSYDLVKHTIAQLKHALYDNKDAPAICAPQIGVDLRLFLVRTAKTEDERFKVFLNPIVVSGEGLHLSRETNLSLQGKQYIIPRKNKIHVAYQSAAGEVSSETYVGPYAEVIQQMIEMLDGITLADYGFDLDDVGGPAAYDKAPKKQKTEVLAMYLETLKTYSSDLAAEIESTPELKDLNATIDFMTGMLTGAITPINPETSSTAKTSEEKSD